MTLISLKRFNVDSLNALGLKNLDYLERLERCGLESLEMRRLKRDLAFVFKILHGLVKLDFDRFFRKKERKKERFSYQTSS